MSFGVGETVGQYKITEYVGQGGMATIYKAHQTTLDRDVALKVIHPALKDDQSFLIRLNREAAIVAKLNHPNIVPVYDFGTHEGTPYLVMRFIEGKTLKALMQDETLTSSRILAISRAIGGALSYAHHHGVLHRDVKPSNVLIDAEDNIFLTDFGLARLAHSNDSTISRDMLIGSPQYISPEQAKGDAIDERSDIYSFGVILFEMFTGRVPYSGETPYATVLAHISDPLPPPRSINSAVPLAVEMVLQKALAKDASQRYASISEMITALDNAISGPIKPDDPESVPIILNPFQPSSSAPSSAPRTPAGGNSPRLSIKIPQWLLKPSKQLIAAGGGVLVVCILATIAFAFFNLRPQQPLQGIRATGGAPNSFAGTPAQPTSVSFATPAATVPSIAAVVLFTPTRPPVTTTVSTTVAPALAEAPRGRIAYSIAFGDLAEQHSIWIANANGSEAHNMIDMGIWPSFSPDGTKLAFYRMKDAGIYIANGDGTNPKKAIGFADICCIQWSPDGKRLVFFRGNLKLGGSIYTANLDGSNVTEVVAGFNPSMSPDGNRIVYTNCQPNTSQCGLFVVDLKTKTSSMLTKDNGANPQWSPRGDKITYQADDGKGHINVFTVNPDGTGAKQLTSGKGNDGQPNWSRDGNFIFWRSDQNGAGWAIYVMRADGTNPRLVVNNTPASVYWGRESLTTAP